MVTPATGFPLAAPPSWVSGTSPAAGASRGGAPPPLARATLLCASASAARDSGLLRTSIGSAGATWSVSRLSSRVVSLTDRPYVERANAVRANDVDAASRPSGSSAVRRALHLDVEPSATLDREVERELRDLARYLDLELVDERE